MRSAGLKPRPIGSTLGIARHGRDHHTVMKYVCAAIEDTPKGGKRLRSERLRDKQRAGEIGAKKPAKRLVRVGESDVRHDGDA